jgi:hypothetical protein
MKKVRDTKTLLFENMAKLNPDFILNEDKNWIQKAVDPEHKGYCTPMTKPTCTPQRKALAKRFKKGIENEGIGVQLFDDPEEFKAKAEKIKAVVDKLFNEEDYDILETLYRMMVERKKSSAIINPTNRNKPVDEDHSVDYQRKADLIKGKIDFLFDNNHYEILDKVDKIINQIYPGDAEAELAENDLSKLPTSRKLIRTAEKDGHLKGMESSATYVMDAARKIADEWDKLHPEQQKIFRNNYYNKFLKMIGKI